MLSKEDNLFQQAKKTDKLKIVNIPVILQVIEKGLMLLGIKGEKHPDEISMKLIVSELKNHYIGLTIGELDLAFTLASRGQLDYDNETYQSFSVLYLNRMLSAYSRWAVQKHQNEKEVLPAIESVPMPDDDILSISLDSYKKFKQWWSIFNCMKSFDILHKKGLIPKDINYTITTTKEAMKRRILMSDPEYKQDLIKECKDDDKMEMNYRRMEVALYFQDIINKEK